MIIYREQRKRINLNDAVRNLRPGDFRELLIDFGILESGLADALPPGAPQLACLRGMALELGRIFAGSRRRLPRFGRLLEMDLPRQFEVTVPEGYAYYALFPESYVEAASEFYRELRPAESVCIGIRSIGTSLSAAVAGTIAELGGRVSTFTVRPFGHPFDRKVALNGYKWPENAHFLIVDEGPGLSGSSFASVAEALCEIGVPDERIILFPAWRADPSAFLSQKARKRWLRHQIFTGTGCASIRGLFGPDWRSFHSNYPVHERLKFLSDGVLAKFSGFGARGRDLFERAQILHKAGFSTRPLKIENGFLYSEFVPARPPENLARRSAEYVAYLRREMPAPDAIPFESLMTMILTNVREGLGQEWLQSSGKLAEFRSILESQPACLLDGRMLPDKWIATEHGILKTDALDHHDDHFFPGPQDIAWDVAAASLETGFDLALYKRLSGDREIERRLPFYRAAYAAFRLAYCRMAQYAKEAQRYESILKRELSFVSNGAKS